MDQVERVLRDIGPCVSGRLVNELVREGGLSHAAARQRLSRNTKIKRLAYLPFPRNARFVYLQDDYGSPKFWDALTDALLENTVSHGGALASLLARGGMMPRAHFDIACGAPAAQKGHLSPAVILERLQQANLVQSLVVPGVGACVQLAQQVPPESHEIARMRARLRAEEVLLLAVKSWARNLGLVSYNLVQLRDEDPGGKQPKIGTFHWDLGAPSYLGPMVEWAPSRPKPGFLVCDVLLGVAVNATHLKPFINKCKTLRSLRGVGRCLQIFLAEGYEPEAFALVKTNGIVPATTESLFGREVAAALLRLEELLADTFSRAANVEVVDEIFRSLSRVEGAATNLRGALFEFIVAEIVRRTDASTELRMNELVHHAGRTAEVDVLSTKVSKEARFIECRGYQPGGTLPDDHVARWLDDRIPLIRAAALEHPFWRGYRLRFELWTTGNVSDAMRQRINAAQQTVSPGKYTIELLEKDDVRTACKAAGGSSLLKTLDEHFLDYPLATAERNAERRQARFRLRLRGEREKRKARVADDDFETALSGVEDPTDES